jgi:DNA-binding GntR family transcriptional regulator
MHLSDRAYHKLKRLIVQRRFGPKQPLSERMLADFLSVSRVPIREAIKVLEREGLLMVLPRRGIFVRHLTTDEVRELYEVRQAIEGMATYLCAARGCGHEMRRHRRRLEAQLARGKRVDHAQIQRESSRFHRAILDLCGNSQLRALYRIIEPQIDLNLRFTALHAPHRIEQALRELASPREWEIRAQCDSPQAEGRAPEAGAPHVQAAGCSGGVTPKACLGRGGRSPRGW